MATSNLRFRIIGDDDASSAFLSVAASAKLLNSTFSDLGSNVAGLTKLVGGAGLIPVLAGATAVVSELGTSLAAGGLALGVFGVSVVGIASDMVKAQKAIGVTQAALAKLTPGTADYAAKLNELHQQQAAFTQDFGKAGPAFNTMTASFQKFKEATRGVTTDVMAKGFSLISSVLPKLVPVANAAGKAVGGLIDDLQGWVKGPGFGAVLKWLETSGPKAITHFGHAIGNLISGLGGIFKNFVGPGDKAAGTLDKLTKRFAAWGHSKGVSDSVNKFLNYVSNNGGQISSVLSSLAQTMPKIAVALGGLGSANLSGISMLLNLVASLPQGVFDALAKGMFAVAAASKLISIYAGLAALATKAWAAAQWLLDAAMDANPIGLIVIAIAALVVGIIIAYKHSKVFREIVTGAFHAVAAAAQAAFGWIKGAATAVFGWLKAHWKLLLAILVGPFGLAVYEIAHHWGQIKAGASNLIGAIRGFFSKVKGYITSGFTSAVGVISGVFQRIIGFAKNYVQFYASLPGKILSAVGNLGSLLYNAGRAVIQGLIDGVQSMVGALTSKLHELTSLIPKHKGPIDKDRVLLKPAGVAIMEGLIGGIESQQIKLTTVLDKITNAVKAAGSKLKADISARNSFASGFQGFSTSIFGADPGQDANGNALPVTAQSILAMQQQQAQQAAQVRANVARLVKLGLSKSLIKQMQAGGSAGIAQIQALASASPAQIKQLNAANAATSGSLQAAGMSAGNAVFGQQIALDRKHYADEQRVLKEIRDLIKGDHGDIHIHLEGRTVVESIRKHKQKQGQKSAV